MTTFQVGQRVRLRDDAPMVEWTVDGTGVIEAITTAENEVGLIEEPERGPLYHVYVGEGMGFVGLGYTRNYGDELEPIEATV